jgi:hypothetical protein
MTNLRRSLAILGSKKCSPSLAPVQVTFLSNSLGLGLHADQRRWPVHRFHETGHGVSDPTQFPCTRHLMCEMGSQFMTARGRPIELSVDDATEARLAPIARTEPVSRGKRPHVANSPRRSVLLCPRPSSGTASSEGSAAHEQAPACAPMAMLDDRPRPGKEPKIPPEAQDWRASLPCREATDLGYPRVLRTTRRLARRPPESGPAQDRAWLDKRVGGTVRDILMSRRSSWTN